MIISLDWDHCATKDKLFWSQFTLLCRQAGHQLIICTFRPPTHPLEGGGIMDLPVYYTSGKAKKAFLASQNVHPDVFIDDKTSAHILDEDRAT